MITLTEPCWLKTLIMSSMPTFMSADTGEIKPGSALLVDARGRASPFGQTVRKLFSVASSSMVTLIATDVASVGIPDRPATLTSSVWPGPIGAAVVTPIVVPRGGMRVSSTRTGVIPTNSDGATVVVVGVCAEALHGLLIIVPAANVAGTAAAAITNPRRSGERSRASDVELWLMLSPLLAPDARRTPRAGAVGVTAPRLPVTGGAQTPADRTLGGATWARYRRAMSSSATAVVHSVDEIAGAWKEQRAERQARRHLDRVDFDALRRTGLLAMPIPVEAGGLWEGAAISAR